MNVAKVIPVALTPVAILIWIKPRLGSTGSSQEIDDAVTTSLWWLAIVLGVWLAASVVIWAAIDGDKVGRSSTWLARLTLPGSKRAAQVMLASAAFAISACSADTAAPVLRAVDTIAVDDAISEDAAGKDPSSDAQQVAPTPTAPPSASTDNPRGVEPVVDDTKPLVEPPPLEVGVDPHPLLETTQSSAVLPTQHTVLAGENLWSIAQAHVIGHDADATGGDIAAYWRELINANANSLRSGEPSLIYVGETLRLPEFVAG